MDEFTIIEFTIKILEPSRAPVMTSSPLATTLPHSVSARTNERFWRTATVWQPKNSTRRRSQEGGRAKKVLKYGAENYGGDNNKTGCCNVSTIAHVYNIIFVCK